MTVPPKPRRGQDEAIAAPASDKPTAPASDKPTAPASDKPTAPASSRATTPMGARQWLWRALAVIVLVGAHEALVRLAAQGDLLARLVADRSVPWLLVTALLYGARMVVLLILPGWLLWLAVATTVRRLHQGHRDGSIPIKRRLSRLSGESPVGPYGQRLDDQVHRQENGSLQVNTKIPRHAAATRLGQTRR